MGRSVFLNEQINALLLHHARQGSQVVRLKAGDPLIFGRGVEEMEALQKAGIPYVIVPGLSSALTGATYAGIPLTHKSLSRSVAILSAHEPDVLPWAALAQLDTVVILMGSRHLETIAAALLQAGQKLATPVAIIVRAGDPDQQVWTGTLGSLPNVGQSNLSPALIVVGEVVSLRQVVLPGIPVPMSKPSKPLAGQTILVTRAETQASALTDLLRQHGARVLELPTLAIVPPASWDPMDEAIANLNSYDWLLLTSANAVSFWMNRLADHGLDSRALAGIQIAVVGSKTAETLAGYGLRPDLMPTEFVADALLDALPDPQGSRFLFPRVESGGREVLVKGLQERGADVTEIAAYQSVCPEQADPQVIEALRARQVDVLTFASSKTVQHFGLLMQRAGLDETAWDPPVQIVAIGPKTADTCREVLGRVDLMPSDYTLPALVELLLRRP
ncbi:MAG: bifunctional uroporphyrinogen-III C-methylase/synthase [Synechococcaceae cyanobacterium SM2_3_2]|nr:bifunctional uroporphyrinogen-III C-methylase/synthase [Synechococcaceae cyanobacterium SM2_3_2]